MVCLVAHRLNVSRQCVAGVVYRNRTDEPDEVLSSYRMSALVDDGAKIMTVREAAMAHGIKAASAYSRAQKGIFGWKLA